MKNRLLALMVSSGPSVNERTMRRLEGDLSLFDHRLSKISERSAWRVAVVSGNPPYDSLVPPSSPGGLSLKLKSSSASCNPAQAAHELLSRMKALNERLRLRGEKLDLAVMLLILGGQDQGQSSHDLHAKLAALEAANAGIILPVTVTEDIPRGCQDLYRPAIVCHPARLTLLWQWLAHEVEKAAEGSPVASLFRIPPKFHEGAQLERVQPPSPAPKMSGVADRKVGEWEKVVPQVSLIPWHSGISLSELAQRLIGRFPSMLDRARAAYCWTATNIEYEVELLATSPYSWPSQAAEDVLARKRGVCQGYASLMVALCRLIGVRAEMVTGTARPPFEDAASLDSLGHAWVAVELDGRWTLHDPTWGSGSVNAGIFTSSFREVYFSVPPHWLIHTHLPDSPDWQLLSAPVSRGEYDLHARLQPEYFDSGITLEADLRRPLSWTTTGRMSFTRSLPKWLMASYLTDAGRTFDLSVTHGPTGGVIEWVGLPPGSGQMTLYIGESEIGHFPGVGRVRTNVF